MLLMLMVWFNWLWFLLWWSGVGVGVMGRSSMLNLLKNLVYWLCILWCVVLVNNYVWWFCSVVFRVLVVLFWGCWIVCNLSVVVEVGLRVDWLIVKVLNIRFWKMLCDIVILIGMVVGCLMMCVFVVCSVVIVLFMVWCMLVLIG